MLEESQKADTTEALSEVTENAELVTLSRFLFDHIENQIKMADSKAWFTITANTLLTAMGNYLISGLLDGKPSDLIIGSVAVSVAGILISLWYALRVVAPILTASDVNNLFYFGNIAKLSEQVFVRAFKEQTREQITCSVLGEVYNKAAIAEKKFKSLQISMSWFFFALVFGTVSLFVCWGWS